MYLVVIAWIYVVLMMAVAEATNTTGTVLGAIVTFFLYGVGPAGLLVYLMGTPARNKALKKRQLEEREAHMASLQAAAPVEAEPSSGLPDAGGHAAGAIHAAVGGIPPGDASVTPSAARVTPVRKEI
jgi:hypothetical protein